MRYRHLRQEEATREAQRFVQLEVDDETIREGAMNCGQRSGTSWRGRTAGCSIQERERLGIGLRRDFLALQGEPDLLAEHVGFRGVRIPFEGRNRNGDVEEPHGASLPLLTGMRLLWGWAVSRYRLRLRELLRDGQTGVARQQRLESCPARASRHRLDRAVLRR